MASPVMAVVCFFSPCGYALPKQHLQTTLRGLEVSSFSYIFPATGLSLMKFKTRVKASLW